MFIARTRSNLSKYTVCAPPRGKDMQDPSGACPDSRCLGRSPGCAAIAHQQMSHCEHFMLVHSRIAVVSRFLLLLFVNNGDIAKLCEALKLLVPRVSFRCLCR